MTTADLQTLQHAAQLIERARGEETPDGNPLSAARDYVTAMEIIAATAASHASTISDLNAKRAFLFQVRGRMEIYYERAALLLQVSAETGLLDKPAAGGGIAAALGGQEPKTLYGAAPPSATGAAVMGIPLPPGSAQPVDPSSMQYYLSPEPGTPPTISPALNLDDLMRDLGAPKDV